MDLRKLPVLPFRPQKSLRAGPFHWFHPRWRLCGTDRCGRKPKMLSTIRGSKREGERHPWTTPPPLPQALSLEEIVNQW